MPFFKESRSCGSKLDLNNESFGYGVAETRKKFKKIVF